MSDLIKLAERCEAAAGADRELDAEISMAIFPWIEHRGGGNFYRRDDSPFDGVRVRILGYTASLDDAMTLLSVDAFWRVGHDGEGPDPSRFKAIASIAKEGEVAITFRTAIADTAPLAVCAAALRAQATATPALSGKADVGGNGK